MQALLRHIIGMAILVGAMGCTTMPTTAVKPGMAEFPKDIRPLIQLTLRVETDLVWWGTVAGWWEKSPLRVVRIVVKNTSTGALSSFSPDEVYNFRLAAGPSRSRGPYLVQERAVFGPLLFTLPPGEYLVTMLEIETPRGSTSALNVDDRGLRFTVTDTEFIDLGTLVVSLTEKTGTKVGAILEGLRFMDANMIVSRRPVNLEEAAYIAATYPFLTDRFLK